MLAAADITWIHVESGYKSELQGKLNVVADNSAAKVQLTSLNGNGDAGDQGAIVIQTSSNNLNVSVDNNTITLDMVWDTFDLTT